MSKRLRIIQDGATVMLRNCDGEIIMKDFMTGERLDDYYGQEGKVTHSLTEYGSDEIHTGSTVYTVQFKDGNSFDVMDFLLNEIIE